MDIWLLGYLAIGAGVGFLAGMLGIGGGALQIPLLVWLFEAQGLPRDHIVHLAVGTGMATILFTSLSSARAHAARGAVRWDIVKSMTPGILVGGLVGSLIASSIPRFVFAVLFVATVYAAGSEHAVRAQAQSEPDPSRTGRRLRGGRSHQRRLRVRGGGRRVHVGAVHDVVQRADDPRDRHCGRDRLSDRSCGDGRLCRGRLGRGRPAAVESRDTSMAQRSSG